MHTYGASMEAIRSTYLDYQKIKNMLRKQIPEMSLSNNKIVNLRREVREPNLTCMTLLMKKQTMPTAGASAERIRLPRVWQQMQKTSTTASASAERIRLPGVRQQQSRNQVKSREQLQLQHQFQFQLQLRQ
jgi:hypothetical protein